MGDTQHKKNCLNQYNNVSYLGAEWDPPCQRREWGR